MNRTLRVLAINGSGESFPVREGAFDQYQAKFSPDGRWITNVSNESGTHEVYVLDFPDVTGKWLISNEGGVQPQWSGTGSEIFSIAPDEQLMAVEVEVTVSGESELEVGIPRALRNPDLEWCERGAWISKSGGCPVFFSAELFMVAVATTFLVLFASLARGISRSKTRIISGLIGLALLGFSLELLRHVGRPNTNEPQAIGDSRTVISAQQTYASNNGGLFEGRFECLSEPHLCLPGYPSEAPIFLGSDVTRLGTKSGYVRSFHPGLAARQTGSDVLSTSSVEAFAYVSVPASELTGTRAYCADSTGTICFTPAGTAPVVVNGLCRECRVLE